MSVENELDNVVTLAAPERTERALAGKHVVVTGFTGFLAKVYVALLLEQVPDIGRITLLVRPRGRVQPAKVRVERIVDRSPVFRALRATHGQGLSAWLSSRLDAIDADVEKPGCGISAEDLQRLAGADVVVHCAGLTDFEPDPVRALSANVAGALHTAQVALRLRAPLVHVSTCYVAGSIGKASVAESLEPGVAPSGQRFDANAEVRALQLACRHTPDAQQRVTVALERARVLGWPNIYTYTKGLAEHVLAGVRGLETTIVRPSIVECARSFPFPGWNEGLNTAGPLAWLISTAFRRFPTVPHHTFDVVPVDDVARGLGAITGAALTGRAGGVFQLASSDHAPLTFDRAVELTGLGMRRWTRKGGGTAVDRALFRLLDPVPVPVEKPGPFAASRVARWAKDLRITLGELELPEALKDLRTRAAGKLLQAEDDARRVDKMLQMYRPFVHDNDWTFRTDRARSLSAHEGAFRFDLRDLDWCDYWVDVEYPGLRKWCIPILHNETIENDPPSSPPFRLERAQPWSARAVGK
ncbi:MAG: SDR family oxidoreductase [Myxococcales bacterium]|nr:SDR family oxidoreductase [Myxococcales bacterium]